MTYVNLTIVGNVGRDPELRYTPSGIAVTDFSIATNKRWQDQNGQQQERTTWYRVTCWRRQAEVVAQYVKKGRQVMVIASQIEADAYEGKDGQTRTTLNVTADQVVFLQGGDSNFSGDDGGGGQRNMDASSGGFPQDNDFAPPGEVDDIPF
jgi:single-strand DNA-binding protein